MIQSFPQMVEQYGAPDRIPDEVLGEWLYDTSVRADLINRAKLGTNKIPESSLGREVRRRAKSNLAWLVCYFLWDASPTGFGRPLSDNGITVADYRPMFDLFIQKDDSKTILEQDLEFKSRFLLWPRGGRKSTVDCCDAVQWVLNFPDIRVLFLTAADGLAIGLVDEVKGYFVIRPEEPSLMNLFFPEYCVEEKDLGNQFEFTCPLWKAKKVKRKEPTIMAASVGGTKSGWHYEVIKADDSVSDKNSETPDQCATIAKKIALAQDLLVVGGYYIDYIGTRYDDADFYGIKLEKDAIGEVVAFNPHPCISITENRSNRTKFMVACAIKIKPEVAEQLRLDGKKINYKEAGEEGCDLLMPHVMPYKWLLSEWAREESVFESQKNQNPTPPSAVTFDQPMLSRNTVPFSEIPQSGTITQTWDFAFSFNKKKKGRDFATGSTVLWDRNGRGYVIDLIREKFNTPSLLARAVVDFALKWRPQIIGIEAASGSQLAEPGIHMFADATKDPRVMAVCHRIDWVTPENVIDAKRMRMAAVHPWLETGRLKFVSHLPHLQALYTEFKKCLTSKGHDDIPDVISRQLKYATTPATDTPPQDDRSPFSGNAFDKKQAEYNLLYSEGTDAFGRIGMGEIYRPIVDVVPDTDVPTEAPPGLDPILGAGIYG